MKRFFIISLLTLASFDLYSMETTKQDSPKTSPHESTKKDDKSRHEHSQSKFSKAKHKITHFFKPSDKSPNKK